VSLMNALSGPPANVIFSVDDLFGLREEGSSQVVHSERYRGLLVDDRSFVADHVILNLEH